VTAGASRDRVELVLKMTAPYLAVAVFWCVFRSAWLAILAYHAQILWWSRGALPLLSKPRWTPLTLLVAPSALAGPLCWVLLPYVTRVALSDWLAAYGLAGAGLAGMVLYYGLVHPVLEQSHWAPLRERTPVAHIAFAGYHVLVLYSLLAVPWVAACFVVLAAASWLWQRMQRASGSLVPPIASHIAADLGMVIAAWLLR
jgi:hypothetical protein